MPILWIIVAILVLTVAAVLVTVLLVSRSSRTAPVGASEQSADDTMERRSRDALDDLGSALLARRVELDSRRGTLMGNDDINTAFTALENRLSRGEITTQEFEAEKIRLLSG